MSTGSSPNIEKFSETMGYVVRCLMRGDRLWVDFEWVRATRLRDSLPGMRPQMKKKKRLWLHHRETGALEEVPLGQLDAMRNRNLVEVVEKVSEDRYYLALTDEAYNALRVREVLGI